MRAAGVPEAMVKERARAMREITKMCAVTAPGKKSQFEVNRFVTAVEEELIAATDMKSTLRYVEGSPQDQAVQSEIDFLNAILAKLGIPDSIDTMKKYNVYGQSKPNEKWQHSIADGSKLARIGVILFAGTISVASGVMAYMANPEDPNFNSTLLWLIPTVLAWEGKNLTATQIERVKDELSFMQTREFQDYSSAHRNVLGEPLRKLLDRRKESAKALRTLADKDTSPKTEEKKRLARETLRGILGNDEWLNDPAFIPFALTICDKTHSPEGQRIVTEYLTNAAPPLKPANVTQPPTVYPTNLPR